MHKDSNFNSGLLLGAIIGGAAALFLAPKSGRKTRAIVGSKLDEAKKTWEDSNGDAQATLSALFDGIGSSTDALYQKARGHVDKFLAESRIQLADLKEGDFDKMVAEVQSKFDNTEEEGYNTSWVDKLKEEWRSATDSNRTRRSRKA